jgi:hypothetical protein
MEKNVIGVLEKLEKAIEEEKKKEEEKKRKEAEKKEDMKSWCRGCMRYGSVSNGLCSLCWFLKDSRKH